MGVYINALLFTPTPTLSVVTFARVFMTRPLILLIYRTLTVSTSSIHVFQVTEHCIFELSQYHTLTEMIDHKRSWHRA